MPPFIKCADPFSYPPNLLALTTYAGNLKFYMDNPWVNTPNSRYNESEGTDRNNLLLRIFVIAIYYCLPYSREYHFEAEGWSDEIMSILIVL